MTDKDEARIETLTAEVRVLQVGSRQVTLSMFRQLDWATHTDVEPFGRVKTGDVPPGRPKIGDGASARTKWEALLRSSVRQSESWSGQFPGAWY